jgi:UDP-glucose 4-epimerase
MPQASVPHESPAQAVAANLTTTITLLEMLRPGARYFIHVSTLDVYGAPASLPVDELHPTEPVTYYGAAKLSAEKVVQVYCQEAGIPLLILRPTQVYGPGEPAIKVIPRAIASIAAGQPPVIYGDGSDTRDYVHVSDVAEVIVRALKVRPVGVLNVASGTSRSIAEVVDTILRVSASGLTPLRQPRAKPCTHFAVAISRLESVLGRWAMKDFAEGVREQYDHQRRSAQDLPEG